MNRKVLVVVGVILVSLVSCCGVCMIAGLVTEGAAANPALGQNTGATDDPSPTVTDERTPAPHKRTRGSDTPPRKSTAESAAPSLPSARYECKLSGTMYAGGMVQPNYTPSGSFTIEGDSFTTPAGSGTVKRNGNVLIFSGSDMNGWLGTLGEGGTLYFSENPRVRHEGGRVSIGERWCEPN